MDRELIIRLAREAGFEVLKWDNCIHISINKWQNSETDASEKLERFAALVAAHEREACAKVLEAHPSYDFCRCPCECAAAIRSRNKE